MTSLTHRGHGPSFPYAGQPMHILAGQDGLPTGFAAMELAVPPHFAGPIPHAHDEFDEAIYVLSGRLLVHGEAVARGVAGTGLAGTGVRARGWRARGCGGAGAGLADAGLEWSGFDGGEGLGCWG